MPEHRFTAALAKTARAYFNLLPVVIAMLLLTSLAVTLLPDTLSTGLFGGSDIGDAVIGAAFGSIAAGHPLASYLIGGELLRSGASLIAVTALMVSWVTVGIVQLPAEILMLGARFAVWRNVICFFSAIAIAILSAYTLELIG